MIDKSTLEKIYNLIERNRVRITRDASLDLIKHNYNFSMEYILTCLKKGKIFHGTELYPPDVDDKNKLKRLYCLHRPSILLRKLILISLVVVDEIVIIHISPCNPGSREGKKYYSS